MREITKKIYEVHELSEEARDEAYYNWQLHSDYPWGQVNEESLSAFIDVFPISVNDWQYDQFTGHISFDFESDEDIEELSGIRLMKYIYNNYWSNITSGRFYSLWSKKDKNPYYTENGHAPWGKLKTRYSKIMVSMDNCPFTGYHIDGALLQPIFKFMDNPCEYTTFNDLMDECLNNWVSDCVKDYEYCSSMEYFEDYCEANNMEFDEYGNVA